MYFVYSLLLTAGFLLLLPRFLFDALRHGKYVTGFKQRLGNVPDISSNGQPTIWLHCVSVGETQAARPLVETLRQQLPNHQLVVSTVTVTGQALARELFKTAAVQVIYFPFDWGFSVNKALRRINPSVVLLMETELWPNFIRKCSQRNIPVAVVNGRISEGSYRGYKLIKPFIARVLGLLDRAIMQSDDDAERVRALGMPDERIFVSGSLKFDAGAMSPTEVLTEELASKFHSPDRPLLLAASTHPTEERIVLEAYRRVYAKAASKPRLMIAPRHPERFDEIASLLASSGHSWTRRTNHDERKGHDVVLLDTIGELTAAYPLAAIVFVGGSISPNGGHNIIEPAACGACIITGAHTGNFKTIVSSFVETDAMVQLPDTSDNEAVAELAKTFSELLNDGIKREMLGKAAKNLVLQNLGATEKTVQLIVPLFKDRQISEPNTSPQKVRSA